MKKFTPTLLSLALATIFGLSACNNDSDTSNNNTASSKTITGVITGFGSIFIDGVEYETDATSFSLDDTAGAESDLAIGMVVTLEGTVNADGTTGVANTVKFSDEVEGLVLANNYLTDGTLNIMGQIITVDADTTFESNVATITTIDQIAVNNIVEVSGFSSGTGDIYATRIELKKDAKEAGDEIEVKGLISSADVANKSFMIGNLVVDYSSANLEDLVEVVDGLLVEVKSTDGFNGDILVASKIELENDGKKDDDGAEGEEKDFEGVIMSVGLDSNIVVNGQTVLFDSDTEFENGVAENLLVGTKIKVEGKFNSDGDLVAEEIKFKLEGGIKLEGLLESVDVANSSVNVMGKTFLVSNLTMMKDEKDADGITPVRYFSLNDLVAGDWIELRAYKDEETGAYHAVSLERDDLEDGATQELEGIVEDNSVANQLTVSGFTVDYSANSEFIATIGDKVEMDGTYTDGIFTVIEISIDD